MAYSHLRYFSRSQRENQDLPDLVFFHRELAHTKSMAFMHEFANVFTLARKIIAVSCSCENNTRKCEQGLMLGFAWKNQQYVRCVGCFFRRVKLWFLVQREDTVSMNRYFLQSDKYSSWRDQPIQKSSSTHLRNFSSVIGWWSGFRCLEQLELPFFYNFAPFRCDEYKHAPKCTYSTYPWVYTERIRALVALLPLLGSFAQQWQQLPWPHKNCYQLSPPYSMNLKPGFPFPSEGDSWISSELVWARFVLQEQCAASWKWEICILHDRTCIFFQTCVKI